MNIEKLRKFYQLATKNSNTNEASVAALKFLKTVDQEELRIHFFKGNPPLTPDQIQGHVNEAYNQGLQEGYRRAMTEIQRAQANQQRRVIANGTATGGSIIFHNY